MQPPGFPGLMTAHRASSSVASLLQLQLKLFWCGAKAIPPQGRLFPPPRGLILPSPAFLPFPFLLPVLWWVLSLVLNHLCFA